MCLVIFSQIWWLPILQGRLGMVFCDLCSIMNAQTPESTNSQRNWDKHLSAAVWQRSRTGAFTSSEVNPSCCLGMRPKASYEKWLRGQEMAAWGSRAERLPQGWAGLGSSKRCRQLLLTRGLGCGHLFGPASRHRHGSRWIAVGTSNGVPPPTS
jgi:hypothetical protein